MASALCGPSLPSTCENCGNPAEDTIRCTIQDNKNLCQDCFQGLPEARREDIGHEEWVCDKHFNVKVELFCKTCKCGSCRECAGGIHRGHDVVGVLELAQEIRRELMEQLQEVRDRADKLPRLRMEIGNAIGKIEEARRFVGQIVTEIEEEITLKELEEIQIININADRVMTNLQKKRDAQIENVKKRSRLDMQRIAEINHDMTTRLLKGEEPRKHKIGLMESDLLTNQQACDRLNKQINKLLESTPKDLVDNGPELSSVVKVSSTYLIEENVIKCCREVEDNLPVLKERKKEFYNGIRPFTPLLKFVICIVVIFYCANNARDGYQDEYISFLSSESKIAMVSSLFYIAWVYWFKCFLLMSICHMTSILDYPFISKRSVIGKLRNLKGFVLALVVFEVVTILFVILVSSPFRIFQIATASENCMSLISILQSCYFLCIMQQSKIFKDFGYYLADLIY